MKTPWYRPWYTWLSIGLLFLVVILPCLLLSVLLGLTGGTAYMVINCIELAYLYLSGVFVAAHLSKWAKSHI